MKISRKLAGIFVAVAMALACSTSIAGGDAANGETLAVTCSGCHAADGNSTIGTNPILAGQYESYLIRALTDYRSGDRESSIMSGFSAGLSDQDIRDLAAWFSSQKSDLKVLEKN